MSYKKWVLKYNYLQEELKDSNKLLEGYKKSFYDDFIQRPLEEENNNTETSESIITKTSKSSNLPLKALYKDLSKIYHPDKGGNPDLFSKISLLYHSQDALGLILKAQELGLEIDKYINDKNFKFFENSCNHIEKQIDLNKNTLAWHWATTPEGAKDELKKMMISQHPIEERKK
jgi:hypothetical protein